MQITHTVDDDPYILWQNIRLSLGLLISVAACACVKCLLNTSLLTNLLN